MGFEIHVLSTVNELYFRRVDQEQAVRTGRQRLDAKIRQLQAVADRPPRAFPLEVFDFGVRRRFSGEWQREVVTTLRDRLPQVFKGTSNVLLARDLGLVPIGTMAHEYMQTYQALGVRLRDFQRAALEGWVQEYRGDLGTALTDVVGMDAFLADFDLYFAKLFDGLRHDSGDPIAWGEKALAHYQKLRIEPAPSGWCSPTGWTCRACCRSTTRSPTACPPASASAPTSPTTSATPAADRDEAGHRQRPDGGQAVRLAGQGAAQGRDLPGLPAAGVQRPGALTAAFTSGPARESPHGGCGRLR
jgi:hypothetical protein